MATDLVCGMIVNPDSAPARTTYAGSEYSFCTAYCKEVFEKDPQKFFKDSQNWGKAIDPVCARRITIPLAGAMSVHQSQFIYFCTNRCKEKFDDSPGEFLELNQKMQPESYRSEENLKKTGFSVS